MNNTRRLGVLTLGLAGALAAMLHATTAANPRQGGQTTLRKYAHRNPVAEMVSLRLKGVPVAFGRKVDADDDWLRGLALTVKNTSSKPITYVGLDLTLFDEKYDEVSGKLPVVYPLSYGTYADRTPAPDSPLPSQVIQPGNSVDITLTGEEYYSLLSTLSAAGYPNTMRDAELSVADVLFADGTRWYKSMFLERDPANPKEWINVRVAGPAA